MKKRKATVVPPYHTEVIDESMAKRAVVGATELTDDDITPNDWARTVPQADLAVEAVDTAQVQAMLCRKHEAPLRMQKTTLSSGDEVEVLWCDNCGTPAP